MFLQPAASALPFQDATNSSYTTSSVLINMSAPVLLPSAPLEPFGSSLRDQVVRSSHSSSDTVYVRGFSKLATNSDIATLLSSSGVAAAAPTSIDFSQRAKHGIVWAKYSSAEQAGAIIKLLHQQYFKGVIVSAKYELGIDALGRAILPLDHHNTVIRKIALRKGSSSDIFSREDSSKDGSDFTTTASTPTCNDEDEVDDDGTKDFADLGPVAMISGVSCDFSSSRDSMKKKPSTPRSKPTKPARSSNSHLSIKGTYSSRSIIVDDVDYPFPSGMYLSRIIHLTRDVPNSNPFLRIVTDPWTFGNNYAKEISEAMAMVDCVERTLKLVLQQPSKELTRINQVRVYVVGDGVRPLCAACLALYLPSSWIIYSIDPLLEPIDLGESSEEYSRRFVQFKGLSQDFAIPKENVVFGGSSNSSSSSSSNSSSSSSSSHNSNELDYRDISLLSIVIACHSHAPLSEFWSRTPPVLTSGLCGSTSLLTSSSKSSVSSTTSLSSTTSSSSSSSVAATVAATDSSNSSSEQIQILRNYMPTGLKIAITMPCCANYSDLGVDPIFEFDDFEVYSLKRRIKIYSSAVGFI